MKLIIELENGERFEPNEIDWVKLGQNGSALLVFKQDIQDIGEISQTSFSTADYAELRERAVEFLAFLNQVDVVV